MCTFFSNCVSSTAKEKNNKKKYPSIHPIDFDLVVPENSFYLVHSFRFLRWCWLNEWVCTCKCVCVCVVSRRMEGKHTYIIGMKMRWVTIGDGATISFMLQKMNLKKNWSLIKILICKKNIVEIVLHILLVSAPVNVRRRSVNEFICIQTHK